MSSVQLLQSSPLPRTLRARVLWYQRCPFGGVTFVPAL
jgi:hypothetical protein